MRILAAAAVLALAPQLTSCVAAAAAAAVAGVGYVQYERNEVHQDFEADMKVTWRATLSSIEEMGFTINQEFDHSPTEGEIALEHEDLWVRVERHPEDFTRVRVRIGMFRTSDHRRRSQLLLTSISEKLD